MPDYGFGRCDDHHKIVDCDSGRALEKQITKALSHFAPYNFLGVSFCISRAALSVDGGDGHMDRFGDQFLEFSIG